ncbi:sugar kinase [Ilyobacter sp.]|uniref:sugar kinase n=1 Tax=Ilyobacter sp. TaxID=3100343 RepID=UPI00356A24CE
MKKKVVTLGEILLRLSPQGNKRIVNSTFFEINYGGAEINVAVDLANLGIDTKLVTKAPQNELGDAALRHARSYGVDISNVARGGEKIGTYFLESGFSVRSSKVIYDRKYSAFSKVSIDEFDLDAIFSDACLFHVSGITLAVSSEAFELAEFFMKEAKKRGITVSFDFNYRSKVWTLKEASKGIKKILKYVDIALAGYLDFINILGLDIEKGCQDETILDCYQILYPKVMEKYNFKYIVSSVRKVVSASKNIYSGLLFNGKEIVSSKEYEVDIIDRVGSGDAFTSGFLYGYLTEANDNYKIEFASASAVLKHTIPGDANLVAKNEIEQLFKGTGYDVGR